MHRFRFSVLFWLMIGGAGSPARADEQRMLELERQIEAQAEELKSLRERIERLGEIEGPVEDLESNLCTGGDLHRTPLVCELTPEDGCDLSGNDQGLRVRRLDYEAAYENGFWLRPFDPEKNPFALRINGWIQMRHHAFARTSDTWTDNAGLVHPIADRNAFDIERGRLLFSGHAIDERLTYFLHLDGDTDGRSNVDFFDYWWAWRFDEDFQLQMGKRKVPFGRQWLLSARHTRLADRPMAIDFFRPDRSTGIAGMGTVWARGRYEWMISNGYSTANLAPEDGDTRLTLAVTNYFDFGESLGDQLVDYQWSEDPAVRLGHSFVFSPQASELNQDPLDEIQFIRLGDGTRLTGFGSLAPLATVNQFDVWMYGLDGAFQYRGWSLNSEACFRWIEDLSGTGPVPEKGIFQWGSYIEGGKFLIRRKLDLNLRYSHVYDRFGSGQETAVGSNWFPVDDSRMKVTFDVAHLNSSPLQSTASDILVGDDGFLFRTQFQAEF